MGKFVTCMAPKGKPFCPYPVGDVISIDGGGGAGLQHLAIRKAIDPHPEAYRLDVPAGSLGMGVMLGLNHSPYTVFTGSGGL